MLGLALAVGFAFTVLVTAIVAFFPAVVMAPFTTDQAVIEDGATFVRIIGLSYLPTLLTLVYSGVLRSTGMPRLPLIASAAATVVNLALDYVLIFGKWGFPQLGLTGAAIGTATARLLEVVVILIGVYASKHLIAVTGLGQLRGVDRALVRRFAVLTLPVATGHLLWVLGESLYVVIYGRMGTEALVAMTLTFPVQNLAIAAMTGIASGAAVLVGQRLGRGDVVGARRCGNKLIGVGVAGVVAFGLSLVAASWWYVGLYDVDASAQRSGQLCLVAFAAFLWVKIANMVLSGAVLQSGGDSHFVFVMETASTWCLGVPTALLAAFAFDLPVWVVFALLSVEEVPRLLVGGWRLRSGRWVRDLAEPAAAQEADLRSPVAVQD